MYIYIYNRQVLLIYYMYFILTFYKVAKVCRKALYQLKVNFRQRTICKHLKSWAGKKVAPVLCRSVCGFVYVCMSTCCLCLCAFLANCLWLWSALKQWTHHNHNFCCCLISEANASDGCVCVCVGGRECDCWNIMHNLTGFPSRHSNCWTDFGLTLAFGLIRYGDLVAPKSTDGRLEIDFEWRFALRLACIMETSQLGLHKPWKAAQTPDWTNRKATLHFSQGTDV